MAVAAVFPPAQPPAPRANTVVFVTGQKNYHEFFYPPRGYRVAVPFECSPTPGGGCTHRVFVNEQGIADMKRADVQEVYNHFLTDQFYEMFSHCLADAQTILSSKRVVKLVIDYVWSPHPHFREAEMNSRLPLYFSQAHVNGFGTLLDNRYCIDDTKDTALVAMCASPFASPDDIRKLIRRHPAIPVTSTALEATCRRPPQLEELGFTEKENEDALEIAFFLLSHRECKIDHLVVRAMETSRIAGIKTALSSALLDYSVVRKANTRARKAREFERRLQKSRSRMRVVGDSAVFSGGVTLSDDDRGSEEDVEVCLLLKYIIRRLRRAFSG
jgi:hypothetical protein